MTKKKTKTPPRPPQTYREAVFYGALAEITDADVEAFAGFVYGRKKSKAGGVAIMKLATLGLAARGYIQELRDGKGTD